MQHDADGRIVEVGAKTRTIPPALRRALLHRDHRCRFPGCTRRFCQGHHIRHWAAGGRPRSRISRCPVAATIAPSTKRDIRSIERRMASFGSGVRTVGSFPSSRLLARCRMIRRRWCEHATSPRGCDCTRTRRRQGGSASAWTWVMRLTSCIRWPGSQRPRRIGSSTRMLCSPGSRRRRIKR